MGGKFIHHFVLLLLLLTGSTHIASSNQPEAYSDANNLTSGSNSIEESAGIEDIEHTLFDDASQGDSASTASEKTILPRTTTETILCLGVLAFGIFLIFFTGFIAMRKGTGWDAEVTRIFTVSVIVTAGLFLITAGYSDQQIAPMFGLLGTIVGYLLGKSPSGDQGTKPGP